MKEGKKIGNKIWKRFTLEFKRKGKERGEYGKRDLPMRLREGERELGKVR